jgi:monoamine oxidase
MAAPDRFDVVVGAGFAGLACAERLATAGARFVVLEAADRPGGRARTDYQVAAGRPLELGAQMIHGRNVVTQRWVREEGLSSRVLPLLQKARILREGRAGAFPWLVLPFYPGFGLRVAYRGMVGVPRRIDQYRGPDLSLGEFLESNRVPDAASLLVQNLYAHVHAADMDQVGIVGPAEEVRRSSEPFGFRNFQVIEGYGELVRRRAARLGERIRTGFPVTRIRWGPEGVVVFGEPAAGRAEASVSARCAVVTVSLGVLHSGQLAFEPTLPIEKRRVIERIAFGPGYALHLRLRGAELRDRLGDFSMLWAGGSSTFPRPLRGLGGMTDILDAFTVGREAARRATLSDRDLVEATLEELRAAIPPGTAIGEVADFVVHRWPTDPRVPGAYSFLGPGAHPANRETPAQPVGGSLFFAGEATHDGGEAATVHGAIDTGYRAADEVLAGPLAPRTS